jgi:hypothetical protein
MTNDGETLQKTGITRGMRSPGATACEVSAARVIEEIVASVGRVPVTNMRGAVYASVLKELSVHPDLKVIDLTEEVRTEAGLPADAPLAPMGILYNRRTKGVSTFFLGPHPNAVEVAFDVHAPKVHLKNLALHALFNVGDLEVRGQRGRRFSLRCIAHLHWCCRYSLCSLLKCRSI